MVKLSNNQIDRAGKVLKSNADANSIEYSEALSVVNEWRSLHSKPLNAFQTNLRGKAKNIDVSFVLSQRLKKLKSIKDKLQRYNNMKLSSMQDIGGCRIILSNLEFVHRLKEEFASSYIKHKLRRFDNYIESPKSSGYRGLHLSFEYFSDKNELLNGLNIEVQIRTRFQHLWATAVETASLVSETTLKAGEGEREWLDFFKLISSYFALQEKTEIVPGTPDTREGLISEIAKINKNLDLLTRFEVLNSFTKYSDDENVYTDDYYLLYINKEERKYRKKGFKKSEYERAYNEYITGENKENGVDNIVLVSTNSVESLKNAYPNYFADMNEFITVLRNMLE
ncbi:MAG: RelA/SpoT domain-containing protein [Chitinispirillales bacterium]|jgi:ppGpp synthetase/RelA/SpoT-type nucleotidyltranferase|nr:RelA/SpoT domain-containing protein [Chitinispirillales bacterium]